MTVELGLFDIVLYALLLCVGAILCYKLPSSVNLRRKRYEAMVLDLLKQRKIEDAAYLLNCLHEWHFTKETHVLAALVFYETGDIERAKEHLATIRKQKNILFLYLISSTKLHMLFDELNKHN